MKVELIDHMGSDLTVANAARVSFDKESEWEYDEVPATREWEDDCGNGGELPYVINGVQQMERVENSQRLSAKDTKLINYLGSHGHWTPFAHPQVTFRWTVPIFMARQLLKHQIGLVVNEVSRRYVDDIPELYMPDVWRGRAENAKQGSSDEPIEMIVFDGEQNSLDNSFRYEISISEAVEHHYRQSLSCYKAMIHSGVAPEQARMVLPQSMYTSFYWTGSLAAWARVMNLRNKPDAQKEHKVLCEQLEEHMVKLFPVSWKALTES